MNTFLEMTNAIKAQVIVLVNAVIGLLTAFGVDLTDKQQGALIVFVNAVFGLWVLLTYQYSHKRATE
jgi:hypothetical protein